MKVKYVFVYLPFFFSSCIIDLPCSSKKKHASKHTFKTFSKSFLAWEEKEQKT